MELQEGMTAYLIQPYRGHRAVRLIEKSHYKWTVELIGNGKQIQVYDDELEID